MGSKKKKSSPFVMIYKAMIESHAWQQLGHPAVRAYIHLRAKVNGKNNDNLSLTYKEMEPYMNRHTFAKALKQLEEHGFIKFARRGGLYKRCNIYALSDEWTGKGKPDAN